MVHKTKPLAYSAVLFLRLALFPIGCEQQLRFAEATYNFSQRYSGDIIEHTFYFDNASSHPIEITDVKPPCCVFSFDLKKNIIAPGEESSITIYFDSRGREGPVREKTELVTDCGTTYTLALEGILNAVIDYAPKDLDFGEVRMDSGKEKQVYLFVPRESPLVSLDVEKTADFISIAAVHSATDNDLQLTISVKPTRTGKISEFIKIRTEHTDRGEITIPIRGYAVR